MKQNPNTNSDLNPKQYRQMFGLRPSCGETTRETSLRRPSDISGYRDLGRIQDHVRRMFTPDQIPSHSRGWKRVKGHPGAGCSMAALVKGEIFRRMAIQCFLCPALSILSGNVGDRLCAMAEGQSDICRVRYASCSS